MNPENPTVKVLLLFLTIIAWVSGCSDGEQYTIDGELKTWHTLTISFKGPDVSEQGYPNPFLNHPLMVEFAVETDTFIVPGYFAADGNASESRATSGTIWQVRFKPNRSGKWTFKVSFREGHNMSINDDPGAGTTVAFDGLSGSFNIKPTDNEGLQNLLITSLSNSEELSVRQHETMHKFNRSLQIIPSET